MRIGQPHPRLRAITVIVAAAMALTGIGVVSSAPATADTTSSIVAHPDAYKCSQRGFITFESLRDGTNLSKSTFDGIQFSTTNGYTWLVGDFATHNYNGKYPSGSYTSQGSHWAWLGTSQGSGRMDLVDGPASYFSLLVSNLTPVSLDAYDSSGKLIGTAGPSRSNTGTGTMNELRITTGSRIIDHLVVHDTGNYFEVDSVCSDAPGLPTQPLDDFKQNKNADGTDVAWANDRLYNLSGCSTMAQEGCAITAVTDVFSSYGLRTVPDGTPVDPGHVNTYLGKHGGNSDCYILWAMAGKVLGYRLSVLDFAEKTTLEKRVSDIDAALAAGNLVVMGTGKHYIVLYAKASAAADGSPDYYIADPYRYKPHSTGDRSGKLLSQTYGTVKQLSRTLQVVVYENKAPRPGKAWAVVAHSPVQLLISDPNGAKTGYGPDGSSFSEIPGATYGIQPGLGDDTEDSVAEPDVPYFEQGTLVEGTYKIQVIGTGTGPYRLDLSFATGPNDSSTQSVAGHALPGSIDTYLVTGSPKVGETPTIVRQVPIDIRPGGTPNPINVGSGGVTPVALLSTPTFNARNVDFRSIKFGPSEAAPTDRAPSLGDVNADGLPDMVLHFKTAATGIQRGSTSACLSGRTTDDASIRGCDAVITVP
jgi:hypothetical protein